MKLDVSLLYQSQLKIKVMTQSKVQQAFDLWVATLPLATTDIDAEPAKWHGLYSKECELFGIMRTFTEEEKIEYRSLVERHEGYNREEELQWDYMNGEYPDDF